MTSNNPATNQIQLATVIHEGQGQTANDDPVANNPPSDNPNADRSCCAAFVFILWGKVIPVFDLLVSFLVLITTIIVWIYAQSDKSVGGICCGLLYSGENNDILSEYADGCTWSNVRKNGMIYTNLTDGIQYCMTHQGVVCNEGIGNQSDLVLPLSVTNGSDVMTLEQCMNDGGYDIMDVCDPDRMEGWYKDAQAIILPLLGTATIIVLLLFIVLSISDLMGGDFKSNIKTIMYKGCCCACYRFLCCCFPCVEEENWEKGMKIYGWICFKILCWIPPYIFAVMVENTFGNRFFNVYGNAVNLFEEEGTPERKIFNADPGFIYSSAVCAGDGSTVYVDYSESPLVLDAEWIMNINDWLGTFGLIRSCAGMGIGLLLTCFCQQGFGGLDIMTVLDLYY